MTEQTLRYEFPRERPPAGEAETRRPALARLAARYGILPSYVDQGGETRTASDATRQALLRAMGVDASSEARALVELRRCREESAAQLLQPVRVVSSSSARQLELSSRGDALSWSVEVRQEDGTLRRASGRVGAGRSRRAGVRLPFSLPTGYHELRLSIEARRGGSREASQTLIVAPPRCPNVVEVAGRGRVYGLLVNLYSVRSRRNWGIGDLTDLRAVVDYAASAGAVFVGVNPLHALANRGDEISPYSPVSRLYRNPLYLDVTAIPELSTAPAVRTCLGGRRTMAELARLRRADRVEYEAIWALERPLLEALHREFARRHSDQQTSRGRAYRRYLDQQGSVLVDYATFRVLAPHLARRRSRGGYWRKWPAAYRDPGSAAVREFRDAHREEVDFHCYLQFELDRQLAGVATHARVRGLSMGIYQDLAVGSSDGGSDAWGFPGLFCDGASVGAPPDDYSADGQNWGLPPLHPHRLAADGYRYWIRLIRAAMAHSGALRIDHVMGIARQFWIPTGESGTAGAYVRFPFDDLLGILALESRRAGVLVIGEDLGTVPRGLPQTLWRRGILSNRVIVFGQDRRGRFRPSKAYPRDSLVSANTHDMAPCAGYWGGTDLDIKRRVGLLSDAAELATARVRRAAERASLLRRLRAEKVLPRAAEPSELEVRRALHAFACRTPAALVGISLDDLGGETAPVNQPGVSLAHYPSWQRRMRVPVEDLPLDAEASYVLGAARQSARGERRKRSKRRAASGAERNEKRRGRAGWRA